MISNFRNFFPSGIFFFFCFDSASLLCTGNKMGSAASEGFPPPPSFLPDDFLAFLHQLPLHTTTISHHIIRRRIYTTALHILSSGSGSYFPFLCVPAVFRNPHWTRCGPAGRSLRLPRLSNNTNAQQQQQQPLLLLTGLSLSFSPRFGLLKAFASLELTVA